MTARVTVRAIPVTVRTRTNVDAAVESARKEGDVKRKSRNENGVIVTIDQSTTQTAMRTTGDEDTRKRSVGDHTVVMKVIEIIVIIVVILPLVNIPNPTKMSSRQHPLPNP